MLIQLLFLLVFSLHCCHSFRGRSHISGQRSPGTTSRSVVLDTDAIPLTVQNMNKFIVSTTKNVLMVVYGDRDFARFYALETIARVPYFSYASVLHLFETIGFFRQKEFIKLHFSQSWNELHHLLIMEELGGNSLFVDRFVAQHIAFFYYWFVVTLYALFPAVAYNFNQHVEEHAYLTYTEYIEQNSNYLKSLPAPAIAIEYYMSDVLFLDPDSSSLTCNADFESNEIPLVQRPTDVKTLYDVFVNIRADEAQHARTMKNLQQVTSLLNREPSKKVINHL